jgi:hypothetical protein
VAAARDVVEASIPAATLAKRPLPEGEPAPEPQRPADTRKFAWIPPRYYVG